MRRILLSLVIVLVAAPAAQADTTWTRVAGPAAEPLGGHSFDWVLSGGVVTGVWSVREGQVESAELVRFTPSRAADAAARSVLRPDALLRWANQDVTVFAAPSGLQLVAAGRVSTDPSAFVGTLVIPLAADGTPGAAQTTGGRTPDWLTAVTGTGGTPLWSGIYHSALATYGIGAEPAAQITGLGGPDDDANGYIPRLGFDRAGRLWLAYYSNSNVRTGINMVQLDPATGVPVGPLQTAPASHSAANNDRKLAFACHDVCRVAYQEADSTPLLTDRIVTWAPGEASATLVARTSGFAVASLALAYRADGRLWTAWVDRNRKRVTAALGNNRGGAARTIDAGAPPLTQPLSDIFGLEAMALGDDLLLNANAGVGPDGYSQYVNVVLPPGAVDTSGVPNPRVVTTPGGKVVYPGRVDTGDLGPGRCVRVKPVADKPARIWAQIFSGRRNGKPFSNRVAFRFTKPGTASKCVKLARRPAGFYKGKVFRIKFDVRTGANAKPAERNRPPWRTQPRLVIDA